MTFVLDDEPKSGNGSEIAKEPFTKVELERVIRACRASRDRTMEQKLLLQERELGYGDRYSREAILTCENEIFILTAAIAKLWVRLYSDK